MMKRILCAMMILCLMAALSGCSRESAEREESVPAMPAPRVEYDAPDGDSYAGAEKMYTLYLPGKNGLYLLAQHVNMGPGTRNELLVALVSELLSYPANERVDSLGGEVSLSLYGPNPVELSGGVCTVNLGSSALGLSYRNIYTVALAVAATLCEVENIRCVNILVADQSVALDVTGNLAMGSLVPHPGENLPVLWEQMDAKKTPLGADPAQTPMTAYLTIYYPLENGQGVSCESRTLTFQGQTPAQMTSGILETISNGPMYLTGVPDLPDLGNMLTRPPLTSDLPDGGRMITLSFREDAMEIWRESGVDPACLAAAVTFSLTTFIPGTAAVSFRIGEKPLTALSSEKFGEIPVLGGLMRREQLEPLLMDRVTVFFQRGGVLVPCEKAVDRDLTDSPREQLIALIDGPGARERADGLMPTLPDLVNEEDILGVARVGDTMLVNLSESFRAEIQSWGKEGETLLCYSMVNTLCENNGVRRVVFFFEGEQVDEICGVICWSGTFDYNTGLCEKSFG